MSFLLNTVLGTGTQNVYSWKITGNVSINRIVKTRHKTSTLGKQNIIVMLLLSCVCVMYDLIARAYGL